MAKQIPVMRQVESDAEARYQFAKTLYDAQDEATQEVVMRMIDKMYGMAGPGVVKIRAGKSEQTLPMPNGVQEKNFLWIAMRMLITLAGMDIQVANFTPTPRSCGVCGKPVKTRVKKKVA